MREISGIPETYRRFGEGEFQPRRAIPFLAAEPWRPILWTPAMTLHSPVKWSEWVPLDGAWRSAGVPALPGLYRVRRQGREDLDYIGQTGMGSMTLRKRLAALKGVYGPEMPFRAPHTAGPALWALRQLGGDFEVSVTAIEGTTPWLKGLVAVEIALYRQARGCSPTVNFGRMPSGFRMSTGSDARLVAAGKRHRGGRAEDPGEIVHPGHAPQGSLDGDPLSRSWCGHRWSEWGQCRSPPRASEQRRDSIVYEIGRSPGSSTSARGR